MSRKDYRLIAGALKAAAVACESEEARYGIATAAYLLSGALLDDNPRFDPKIFLVACGLST